MPDTDKPRSRHTFNGGRECDAKTLRRIANGLDERDGIDVPSILGTNWVETVYTEETVRHWTEVYVTAKTAGAALDHFIKAHVDERPCCWPEGIGGESLSVVGRVEVYKTAEGSWRQTVVDNPVAVKAWAFEFWGSERV